MQSTGPSTGRRGRRGHSIGAAVAALALGGLTAAAAGADRGSIERSSTEPSAHTSTEVQPYTSTEVQPYTSTSVQPSTSTSGHRPPSQSGQTTPPTARRLAAARRKVLGTFQLYVPGAAYVQERPGYADDDLVTSPGAAGQRLVVRANRTFRWGKRKGRWVATKDLDYPIILRKGLDGHDWKLGEAGSAAPNAQIVVWDGYTYEFGNRIKPRRKARRR